MDVLYSMASKNTYSYLHNYLHLLVKTMNTDLYLRMGQDSSEYSIVPTSLHSPIPLALIFQYYVLNFGLVFKYGLRIVLGLRNLKQIQLIAN